MKIGIMGARGSFSEEAAKTHMMKEKVSAELDYLISAEKVLSALENGEVDLGIFPIENSNGGIVIEAVYAMAKHRFEVEKMFEIEVRMNLMAKKGVNTDAITAITSHDQALKQCRMYLKRRWPDIKYPQTSKSLSQTSLPSSFSCAARSTR